MFFIASKIFWAVATPSNVVLWLALAGALLLFTRWRGAGRRLCVAAALGLLLLGWSPLGGLLLQPLEGRFPLPPADMPAPDVILVLGGAGSPELTAARGLATLNQEAGRMTAAVALARRFPGARVVFSGGSGVLRGSASSEADVARRFLAEMGVAAARLGVEDRSRNTYENALFTQELFQPQAGERWLLVTSAAHMPRAVGIFRQAGFPVTAYPAQYHTAAGVTQVGDVSRGLALTDAAVREWVGLLAYRAIGRTGAFFPAP